MYGLVCSDSVLEEGPSKMLLHLTHNCLEQVVRSRQPCVSNAVWEDLLSRATSWFIMSYVMLKQFSTFCCLASGHLFTGLGVEIRKTGTLKKSSLKGFPEDIKEIKDVEIVSGGHILNNTCFCVDWLNSSNLRLGSSGLESRRRVLDIKGTGARGHHSYTPFCYVHASDHLFCHLVQISVINIM